MTDLQTQYFTESRLNALRKLALDLLEQVEGFTGTSGQEDSGQPLNFYEEVRRFEGELIRHALVQTNWSQVRAARMLGLRPSTLNVMLKRLNIERRSLAGRTDGPHDLP